MEAEMAKKQVLDSFAIYPGMGKPTMEGIGRLEVRSSTFASLSFGPPCSAPSSPDSSLPILVLSGPISREGLSLTEADLVNGLPRFAALLRIRVDHLDLSRFQRLRFKVQPRVDGGRALHLRCGYINEGPHPVPDIYGREGQYLCNLENHVWNDVIWECPSLPKDDITSLWFNVDIDGADTASGINFYFDFTQIVFESIAVPEQEKGWQVQPGQIAYSMAGYLPDQPKKALVNGACAAETFELLNEAGAPCFLDKVEHTFFPATGDANSGVTSDAVGGGSFGVLDFSEVTTPGFYRIRCGELISEPFKIDDDAFEEPIWKLLNFIFCERCGYPVPEKHGRCHSDLYAKFKDMLIPYAGGWHDAGDLSQQTLQTAELMAVLFALADKVKASGKSSGVDEDPPRAESSINSWQKLLYQRLMEEGLWGLEQTLKSRLGGGYRATSVGLSSWSDGIIGTEDDPDVRVHAQAYQNFFMGACEAQAALTLKDYDSALASKALDAAKEDYIFAKERFEAFGIEYPILWEHTLNSSLSLYYATALWCCGRILLTEETDFFRQEAESWAAKLIACQEQGDAAPLRGFFYRDETHQHIVHFNHQGRDHLFAEALITCCQAIPESSHREAWEKALRLHGEYLKALRTYASPYGMLPAGLHHESEVEDKDTFKILHLLVNYEEEKPNYLAQLHSGQALGNGYFLRQFPIWFSFRGNSAMHLGMGRAAALLSEHFHDPSLKAITLEQLEWVFGKNRFAQSLVYGVGHRYASMDANFPGETVGEAPVGIQTSKNEDVPYWPAACSSTYKEVWLTTAERILGILAVI